MAVIESNDVWANQIGLERPTDAKIAQGFECGDADPDIFNWLFAHYAQAIVTLKDRVDLIVNANVSQINIELDDLQGRVLINEQILSRVSNTEFPSLQRLAKSSEITGRTADNSTVSDGRPGIVTVANLFDVVDAEPSNTVRSTLFAASVENIASSQATTMALTAPNFRAWLRERGSYGSIFANKNNDTDYSIYLPQDTDTDREVTLIFPSSPYACRGLWCAEYIYSDDSPTVKHQYYFMVNFFEDNGDFPDEVNSRLDLLTSAGGVDVLEVYVTFIKDGNGVETGSQLRLKAVGTQTLVFQRLMRTHNSARNFF